MSDHIHLILHDVIGIISAIVSMAVLIFVLMNNHRRTINIIISFMIVSVIVFLVSHVIGTSVADHELSRQILMWNVSVIFICMFNFHAAMLALHKEKETKLLIWAVYLVGLSFVATFLIFPDSFILTPVAKMYFPNYYVPGTGHLMMRLVFQIVLPAYFVYALASAWHRTTDTTERNRYLYFAMAFGLGWLFGFIPIPLIFNYQVDPMLGLLFPVFFAIPFTYAVLRYELMDIRIVAKKAFLYGISVVGIGFLISLFDLSNQWIQEGYPGFPIWIMPLCIATLIVFIGIAVWKQLRESEILKYEFLTTVTHKFRTPLTHIKWAAENLKEGDMTPTEITEQLGYIEGANKKLTELTDLLSNASEADENLYRYKLERGDLSAFVLEVAQASVEHMDAKKIPVFKLVTPNIYAMYDVARLRFVLQTLIENALNYTPNGSPLTISLVVQGRKAVFSVKDSGIGIPRAELQYIFTKLYRGKRARSVDTEGMGIGLFMSKGIISRHHGKIWVESDGENRGSTFSFSLPVSK